MTYQEFLESKVAIADSRGADIEKLSSRLKPHQRDICRWALRGGRRAIFADFGLGKTNMQIQICSALQAYQGGSALIVCPLGVKAEFVRDGHQFFEQTWQYVRTDLELSEFEFKGQRLFLTNYERVRDGDINPNRFEVVSLDEASILRSFGSKTYQTFLPLFDCVPFKFVATATPSPNRFKELIHYAGFLGVMDTGQALTRFFKRNPKKAGDLTLHPHKEAEFRNWLSTWATFLTKPSDLGYSDDGYTLLGIELHNHRLPVDHSTAGFDSWGQGKLLRDAAVSLREAAREKRDSLENRILRAKQIIAAGKPDQHWIIWHDLEDERRAIQKAFPEAVAVWGSQDIDEREQAIADFSEGRIRILATKPILSGSGCNLQRHCHSAIYLGIGFKFNDFIQSVHRIYRFLQTEVVQIHLIYTESEDAVLEVLMQKWKQHDELRGKMSELIRENGLTVNRQAETMRRSIGITRQEVSSDRFTLANNDNVIEMERFQPNSVDLVISSWPFSNQYEYTPSYNDFGHNVDDDRFFEQMDFLTPPVKAALKPGRMYCVHCKDRLLYGSVTGLGMYSVNPFSDSCVAHLRKHGLIYCGRITIVTDVVRENNQTYRLGYTENSKDGTKMGVGSPEYILLFRKLPTERRRRRAARLSRRTRAYADEPVPHPKPHVAGEDPGYSRSRWQFDAHSFWRSSGNRFLSPDEIKQLPQEQLRVLWHAYNESHVYDFSQHVEIAEKLEAEGLLPSSFMLLDPKSHSPWVWDDVVRMRTLNCEQARARVEQHICPLQFDVVERLIERYSQPGELVLDPFGGLMTVPYCAVSMNRKGYGIELSSEYFSDGAGYCRAAEQKVLTPTLFEALERELIV